MSQTSFIDTAKVTDRRTIHFATPADVRADAQRIAAADRAGTLRRTGNWTAGQTFGHLAAWIDYPYDGYPPQLRAPWFIKLILRFQKKKFLRGPMPTGVRIPKLADGTLATDLLPLDEGLARLLRAWDRLEKSAPPGPNPIFGHIPHEEWKTLHLRHAELHLGFLHPCCGHTPSRQDGPGAPALPPGGELRTSC